VHTSSQILDRLDVVFDDKNAVANGGLVLPMTLAGRLGLRELFDERVDLGDAVGHANVGLKAMGLIASALSGGDSIDDADVLRSGRSQAAIGQWMPAPSTLGTFLRSFTWAHSRQLDSVAAELLARAWDAGAGPGTKPLTIDVDSTICEVYGVKKQGAKFGYTKTRGLHPLVAAAAGSGDVLAIRARGGNANSGRGAASFLAEVFNTTRAAGGTGPLTVRADSGFYSKKVVDVCRKHKVRFSITVRLNTALHKAIARIPEQDWKPIPYWIDGGAQVAETTYRPFGKNQPTVRLIVRRTKPTPGTQLALLTIWDHHAFITNRHGDTVYLEADHRRHAEIELVIRDLKEGSGWCHMPSGSFAANAAWMALGAMAHNLARWTGRIGELSEQIITTPTLRRKFLAIPGHVTRSARRNTVHLADNWPWRTLFLTALKKIRALPAQT
jgi:Transposase DDE domain group 1